MKRSLIASLFVTLGATTFPSSAFSESELLLRKHTQFSACRTTVHHLLAKLGARPEQLRLEMDTGAQYRVKLVTVNANLVFRCNKVSETIEVSRTEPGDLIAKGN